MHINRSHTRQSVTAIHGISSSGRVSPQFLPCLNQQTLCSCALTYSTVCNSHGKIKSFQSRNKLVPHYRLRSQDLTIMDFPKLPLIFRIHFQKAVNERTNDVKNIQTCMQYASFLVRNVLPIALGP